MGARRLGSRSRATCFHAGLVLQARLALLNLTQADGRIFCHIRMFERVSNVARLPVGSTVQSGVARLRVVGGLKVLSNCCDD